MKCQRHTSLSAVLMATALCVAAVPAARADDGQHDEDQLGAQWWQHLLSIPAPQNPVVDESGAFCGIGQRGRIRFLHGSFGNPLGDPIERNCTIPTGKRIFLPLINWICIPFPDETVKQNAQACKEINDLTDLMFLEIDGRVRNDLIERRVHKQGFDVSPPDDNVFGVARGVYIAVHDGYFALLPVLRPGAHTIHLQGGASALDFTVDVIYHINVVRPGPVTPP